MGDSALSSTHNITNTITNDTVKAKNGVGAGFEFPALIRIAIYDNLTSIPRVIDIQANDVTQLIDDISHKTYSYSHEMGGRIPYTIIREVVENLIHAYFKEVTISILDNGNHIIISDQGPGIQDKEKAFLPGYTSATREMKKYIRGVGSGLPIVKETITFSGGSVNITDNIRRGTVVSLKLEPTENKKPLPQSQAPKNQTHTTSHDTTSHATITDISTTIDTNTNSKTKARYAGLDEFLEYDLTLRQIKILFLILELGEAGPSRISKELGLSLSTTYRELIYLESEKFLTSKSSGKRRLSPKGIKYLEYYSSNL
ncbi:MAG: histidine kinase [Actinobacteria bacterium]|nr:histidine kinase [Actinomycetota bacterium]